MAYGAANDAKAEYPRRIAYLIGPDQTIREAHANVNASTFAREELERLQSA